jgi:hypothetical protein
MEILKEWSARLRYSSGRYSKSTPIEIRLSPKGRKASVSNVAIKTKKPMQVVALEIVIGKTVFFTNSCYLYGTDFNFSNIELTID